MHDDHSHVDQNFVHLHLHTEYSLLDGFAVIDRAVAYAAQLGMPALAITDHGTMFGVIDFYRACKAKGIKPLIGVESYLARGSRFGRDPKIDSKPYHMLLLAQNQQGYKNLLKLSSKAQLEGFYYRPRIDRELMAQYASGLIATSGCLAAEIPRMVEDGRDEEARQLIGWYQDVFGKDKFFLELQAHDIPQLDRLNRWLVENSKYANVPLVATNDVHYVSPDDYDYHDTLLCIQTGNVKREENRLRMSGGNSYYMRTQAEMWRLFGDIAPQALNNTIMIAEMCEDVELDTKEYHLPIFPVPDEFDSPGNYLRHLCEEGVYWRYGSAADTAEVRERLEYEISVIHDMGFDTYFLIVWDLCRHARDVDIWWNVRGSGAGSVVAYTLGITGLDPLENNLLFERFLNPGRRQMPDFDLDFPEDRRAEMIEYCVQRYGEEKVAAIITFGTLGAKAAIRDVGRAFDLPLTEVDRIARLVPTTTKPPKIYQLLGEDEEKPELTSKEFIDLYESDQYARQIIDTARHLEGVPRHASTHAAGVIVADKPLDEYLPLHRATKDNDDSPVKRVTQFEMETAESIGLLKIDFLGLSTLTILRRACELIEKHHGVKYDMSNIPIKPDPNDSEVSYWVEETFKMLGRGESIGVFQLESSGMRQMLTGMRPKTFEHIIAAISLYRPGPMQFIPQFNKRLHGEESPVYLHPKLGSIIGNTYGIITYQEQIMQIAAELFGYSLGDADLMRRAVSKKKQKDLQAHRDIFMENGPKRGVDAKTAAEIFDQIEFFANYGFNKCLSGNTEIVDAATGRMVKIGDLAAGQAHIEQTLSCDIDSLRLQPSSITAVMENGVKPVYCLTTRLGRQIEATDNHPFYTFVGWRLLGELSVGDKVAVPRRIPVEGTKEWPEHELFDLGRRLTIGHLKSIPSEVFELSNWQITQLIGQIWQDNRQTGDIGNCFVAPSQYFAHQIQHLLLRLNIMSGIREVGSSRYEVAIYEEASSESDIYWDEIVSIEYVGEEMTYDLTIEGTHNFIANDILVHNSHAADYAVITCQTAYLKCRYPHEYMTALMSVYYDDSAKVSQFVADASRMDIAVLPPNVNYSWQDFDIEYSDDDRKHIRFGMGAVKNVGMGSIAHILEEREAGGRFKDLDDFLQRCDMRVIGKRALESLIRVGAMDDFGDRPTLLHNLERLMSHSAARRKDAEIGQITMFDLMGGGQDSDNVGSVWSVIEKPAQPADKREQLRWERELTGLYVTDHPMGDLRHVLQRIITHTSADLLEQSEVISGKSVTVAGLVTELRVITTKKGDGMAILQIEDMHGVINAVMFPKVWDLQRDIVQEDKVLVAYGKADLRNGEVQIIVDRVTQNFTVHSAAPANDHLSGAETLQKLNDMPFDWLPDDEPPYMDDSGYLPDPSDDTPYPLPPSNGGNGHHQVRETASVSYETEAPILTEDELEASMLMGDEPDEFAEATELDDDDMLAANDDDLPPDMPAEKLLPLFEMTAAVEAKPSTPNRVTAKLKTTTSPIPKVATPRQRLVVHFYRSSEDEQDKRALKRIVQIAQSYPGDDELWVAIHRPECDFPVHMKFPKPGIAICDELLDRLSNHSRLGTDAIEVQPL
ncbi:MAG: DNA polymerase III subunit alpha [Anaerolineae bacterium]|nr:DNA polymerase III subunit alpha [Anaerolineae bacterium]